MTLENLRVDPEREHLDGVTGVYVRARGTDDRWGPFDMAQLDRDSFVAFTRSRGATTRPRKERTMTEQLNKGDVVFWTRGYFSTPERVTITRVTPTQALVLTGRTEVRFNRKTGLSIGGVQGRIEHPSPGLEHSWRIGQAKVTAKRLAYALDRLDPANADDRGLVEDRLAAWDDAMVACEKAGDFDD